MKLWFKNRLTTIMEHNEYSPDMTTYSVCNAKNKWTPVDLIIREQLNNGGDSARGFLGLTPSECRRCYNYIKENKEFFIENDMVSPEGYNNFGFTLWKNYNF